MNVRAGRRTSAGSFCIGCIGGEPKPGPARDPGGRRVRTSGAAVIVPAVQTRKRARRWKKAAENVAGGGKTAEISMDRPHQLLKYAKSMCYDMQKYPVR